MDRAETVRINGFEMYFEERGDGEPLLLLHGGSGIGADWAHVFTDGDPGGMRVIVPDLRGRSSCPTAAMGRSSAPRRRHSEKRRTRSWWLVARAGGY
jgi:pimeloyl-ACP methyl ester carboxylesterase